MVDYIHPIKWIDPHGDNYSFHFFIARDGTSHISIDVAYRDLQRGMQMRGRSCALGFSFALPYKAGIIKWNAYNDDRKTSISQEAKKFAEKIAGLIVFA